MFSRDTWELQEQLLKKVEETLALREGKTLKELVMDANQRARVTKVHH